MTGLEAVDLRRPPCLGCDRPVRSTVELRDALVDAAEAADGAALVLEARAELGGAHFACARRAGLAAARREVAAH
jgi:hypothetical protein